MIDKPQQCPWCTGDAEAHELVAKNAEIRTLRQLLKRVIRHFVVRPSWPCRECGRPGQNAPLRLNQIVTEDGCEYTRGCSACNANPLLDEISNYMEGAP